MRTQTTFHGTLDSIHISGASDHRQQRRHLNDDVGVNGSIGQLTVSGNSVFNVQQLKQLYITLFQ